MLTKTGPVHESSQQPSSDWYILEISHRKQTKCWNCPKANSSMRLKLLDHLCSPSLSLCQRSNLLRLLWPQSIFRLKEVWEEPGFICRCFCSFKPHWPHRSTSLLALSGSKSWVIHLHGLYFLSFLWLSSNRPSAGGSSLPVRVWTSSRFLPVKGEFLLGAVAGSGAGLAFV